MRQFDSDDPVGLVVGEQRLGHRLDRHWRGALAHADQYRPVADDMHVPTFDGGRLVGASSSP